MCAHIQDTDYGTAFAAAQQMILTYGFLICFMQLVLSWCTASPPHANVECHKASM